MSIELEGGFDPLVVEWTKQSGGYREDFMVGTSPGASDVVWWGLTLPLWSDYHFSMGNRIYATTFYFSMNKANETQPIGAPKLDFYAEVVDAKISGELSHGGMVTGIDSKSITVTYNCLIESQTPITLSVPVSGYETIVWKWTKMCGSIRNDFAVGTRPYYDDVVSTGISTWAYSSLLHSAFVFPDRESSTFYFSQQDLSDEAIRMKSKGSNQTTDLEAPTPASIPISMASVAVSTTYRSCTPFLMGNATDPSATIVSADSVLELTVWYNCTRPGTTNVTVTVVLEGPYAPISFTWNKRVGKGRNALIIGTHQNWDDVVSRGAPTPLYDPSTYSAFYATSRLYADFYAQTTHPYSTQFIKDLTVTSSTIWCGPKIATDWAQPTSPNPSATLLDSEIEMLEQQDELADRSSADLDFPPNLPPNLAPIYNETVRGMANWTLGTAEGGLLTYTPQHFRIWFNCVVGGSTETNVTFNLADWGPLTISMKVYSGGARPYLDIGTLQGASDVVQGGLPTPLWNSPPLNGAIVSGNVLWTAFWLGMSTHNVTQLMSAPYLTFQTQENIIAPTTSGSFALGGGIDNSFTSIVNVTYNCLGLGTVPMSIGFILPPYDSITFTWTKVCSAQRIGLTVGSTLRDHSIVQNGIPSMAWNPETHVAFVLPTITQTTFWVGLEGKKPTLSPTALTPPAVTSEDTQLISNVIVNSSMPICLPFIQGDLVPGTILHTDEFMSFLVVYNCSDIGDTDIQVTLVLTGNYMPVSFMWTKRAGGTFSGLSVGTSPPTGVPIASQANLETSSDLSLALRSTQAAHVKFSDDVIYYGAATYAYDPFSHTHTTSSTSHKFYVGVDSIPVPMKSLRALPTMAASFSPWLLPSVSGRMSAASMMTNESWSEFSIDPHCLLSAQVQRTKPTVFGFVTLVPFNPAVFAYTVTCPPNIPGLSVGFDTSHTDVVTDGVPHGSWSPSNTSRIEIEADYNILRFWVSAGSDIDLASILIAEDGIIIAEPIADGTLQGDEAQDQGFDDDEMDDEYLYAMERLHHSIASLKANTSSKQASTFRTASSKRSSLRYPSIPSPACRAALTGDVWNTMQITVEPRLLQLELNCSIGGTNNVSVILVPKDGNHSSTVWTFSKTMGGFRHGFDVFIAPAYATNATWTSDTPSDVMEDGEPTFAWISHTPDPVAPGSVPSSQTPVNQPPVATNPAIASNPATGPSIASPASFVPLARKQPSSAATSFVIELSNVYFGRDPLQEYATPAINVSAPGCSPILLGNASSSGYLQKNVPKVIDVVDNCYNSTDGRLSVFEISIAIPPFQPAVWAWSRASTGLPSYLNVDVQLDSKTKKWVPILVNGEAVTPPSWTDSTFALRYYLNPAQFANLGSMDGRTPETVSKQLLAATELYFDTTPLVNATVPACNFALSGNMTDDDDVRKIDLFGAPLVLRVDASACNASAVDFVVSFTALPFTTPMTLKVSRFPPAPQKSKVSSALLGIIIGSTLLIIAAVCIGLYLCLRRPAVAPSTGAYHLRRRKQEREALLSDGIDTIN